MSRVTVNDLHFSRGQVSNLRGINFEHRRGKLLAFLGPSGCGKTTLLWLLAGLLHPERGDVQYDAEPTFGMVFQDGGLWEHLTVREHLRIVLRGSVTDARRVDPIIAATGLTDLVKRRPGELSGGERQRLALARALVVDPQWLLLDEPTSQLDGPAREQMIELLAAQVRSTSAGIFLATHQVDLAMRLSDKIAVLHDGVIAQIGAPADVYNNPVSLAVAKLLGPACEVCADLIRGRDSNRAARVIIRPEQVRFVQNDPGDARVIGCHFTVGFWQVEVELPQAQRAIVSSTKPIPVGATGSLQWVSP